MKVMDEFIANILNTDNKRIIGMENYLALVQSAQLCQLNAKVRPTMCSTLVASYTILIHARIVRSYTLLHYVFKVSIVEIGVSCEA